MLISFKKSMKVLIVILLLFALGCSPSELRKVFFGLSIDDIEKAQNPKTKAFAIDSYSCFQGVLKILDEMDVDILRKNVKKHFILAYGFDHLFHCADSTEVGILIKPLNNDKAQVKVASDNLRLADFVSTRLFEKLEGMKKMKKRRGR